MCSVVGLTGGIGSGKSEVGKVFAGLGAFRIEADLLARQAVAPGSEALERIFARWPQVRRSDGSLDRTALGEIVFVSLEQRAELERIVHPAVQALTLRAMRQAREDQLVIREVPLLFETGLDAEMDAVVLVTAPKERRIERVMARNAWTREQVLQRMEAQIEPEEAARRATYVLRNDGDLTMLQAQAKQLFPELLRHAANGVCKRSDGRSGS
jgi:dephospho-CoA kinase